MKGKNLNESLNKILLKVIKIWLVKSKGLIKAAAVPPYYLITLFVKEISKEPENELFLKWKHSF